MTDIERMIRETKKICKKIWMERRRMRTKIRWAASETYSRWKAEEQQVKEGKGAGKRGREQRDSEERTRQRKRKRGQGT